MAQDVFSDITDFVQDAYLFIRLVKAEKDEMASTVSIITTTLTRFKCILESMLDFKI